MKRLTLLTLWLLIVSGLLYAHTLKESGGVSPALPKSVFIERDS